MRTMIAALLALALSACATVPTDPNIAGLAASAERQQAAALDAEQKRAEQRAAAVTACANSPDVAVCMLGLAAIEAVSTGGGRAATAGAALPAYRPPPGLVQQVGQFITALAPLAGAAVNWHQADVNRDVQIAQYGFLEGIVRSSNETAASIATAGPRIDVGGNYGDTFGDDFTGGDRTDVGGDLVGGDNTENSGTLVSGDENVLGDRNFNSGRQDSPGPIDNSNPGDECEGEGCQSTPGVPDDEGG